MKKSVLTIIGLTTLMTVSYAQQFGIGVVVGVPQNEFRIATEAEGYGLNASIMGKLGTRIVTFGANLNYMIYGRNDQDHDLTADITFGNTVIDRLVIPLRVINTNSIFGFHGHMRVTAPTKIIRPYIEGLLGFRYISTTTRIEDRDNFWDDGDDDNVIIRRTNIDDWIFSYGGGGGLQFEIGNDIYLDFRAYYLLGSEAEFYDGSDTENWEIEFGSNPQEFDKDNIDKDDFTFDAMPRRSTTDMMMFQLGVTFQL